MSRSFSHHRWATERAGRLDELELAHAAVGGTGPGLRAATRQLNHGYAVLVAAEFQGFCRDLHTEAAEAFAAGVPAGHRDVVIHALTDGRQLDRGNATATTIRADFHRFNKFDVWAAADRLADGRALRRGLEELNAWRNAVAHSDFEPARLGGTILLRVARVRRWRANCRRLARVLDRAAADELFARAGARPW